MSHRFEVWAPRAARVDLVLGSSRRVPMGHPVLVGSEEPNGTGWWVVDVEDAGPGTDYGFSLDRGPVRPDPRSRWQPHGPEGLSRVIDLGAFAWSDERWRGFHLPSAVFYELHVGTFGPDPTFAGVSKHLDHLVQLGVTAVELMPVAEFPGDRGWGYDGVCLYAPHHGYGAPAELQNLVDACHARGLAVLLDVVYNHLGPAGNHLPEFGPYFTDRHRTAWGPAVNLDGAGSDEVRRFIVDNARMWLSDYHLDGLRLDAVHAFVDTSASHILEELSVAVAELSAASGWRRWLVAESDLNDPRLVRSREAGGLGVDAQWSDDFHHALHALLTGERDGYYADFGSTEDLGRALEHAFVYTGQRSRHRRRRHGRSPDGLPGWAFLGYSQNHDQVGNRAAGERSSALLGLGRLKVAAALVLTSPFVPLLFQGEEWAASTPFQYFTSHPDPGLGRAVSDGRRQEFAAFGWDVRDVPDPQDEATFRRSCLDWQEVTRAPHQEVLAWYQALIELRRSLPELVDGRLDHVRFAIHAPGAFTVTRGRVAVAVNLGPGPETVPIDRAGGWPRVALASEDCSVGPDGVLVPADSVAVVVCELAGRAGRGRPSPAGD